MADSRWEKYLWDKHHAVALSVAEVDDNLEPLAVLVKLQSKKKRNGFKIRKVGSLSSLRKDDAGSNQAWLQFHKQWPTSFARIGSRSAIRSNRFVNPNAEVVKVKDEGEFWFVDTSSCSCLFSLLAICGVQHARTVEARAEGVQSVSLNAHKIIPLLTADEPVWRPDLDKLQQRISWDDLPRSQTPNAVELWVVTEVKFAKRLSLSWGSDTGVETGVDAPAEVVAAATGLVTGVPVPVPIRASIKLVLNEKTVSVSSAHPSRTTAFAFKAIRLVYDRETGHLVSNPADKGEQPQRRGRTGGGTDAHKHYDMADFFESDEDGSLLFQCLEIDMESTSGGPSHIRDTESSPP